MSKVIGTPLAVKPSSPPSGAVGRSTRSPANLASVNPRFMPGSVVLKVSDWAELPGTIAPPRHTPPSEPRPPSRIWS